MICGATGRLNYFADGYSNGRETYPSTSEYGVMVAKEIITRSGEQNVRQTV